MKEDVLGSVDVPEKDYNLMESIIIRLGRQKEILNSRMIRTLQAIFGKYSETDKDTKLKELGFQGTSLAKEVKNMYSFSDMYEDRGIKKERAQIVKKLNAKGFSSKDIASMLDIKETEVKVYLVDGSKLTDA